MDALDAYDAIPAAAVEAYVSAVNDYLAGLTHAQWDAQRNGPEALAHVARIGLTAALPHLSGWRPIAEAPKSQADGRRVDGIYLLGFIPDPDFVSPDAAIDVIWWEPLLPNKRGGRGKWVANRFGEACDVEPTLWQPLPPPPGQEVDGGR